MKEKCTRCGRETEYEVSTPVTVRRYYVEGAGQLCEECLYRQTCSVIKQQVETAILQSATIDPPLSHRVCHP